MRAIAWVTLLLLGAAALSPDPATAHAKSLSYSSWQLDEAGAERPRRAPLRLA